MRLNDIDSSLAVLRVVLAVVSLFLLVSGISIATSRRFFLAWRRVARPPESQRHQPVRVGGGVALIGASLLLQQAPFLIALPYPVGVLLLVALLLAGTGLAWFVLLRR